MDYSLALHVARTNAQGRDQVGQLVKSAQEATNLNVEIAYLAKKGIVPLPQR